jgi:hypothetical protein
MRESDFRGVHLREPRLVKPLFGIAHK